MPKKKKTIQKKREKKLSDTPFNTIEELEEEEKEIEFESWRRIAVFKTFEKQFEKQYNTRVKKHFENGILCGIIADNKNDGQDIVRAYYKQDVGIQILINPKTSLDPKLISSLAGDMAYAFGSLFYEITGLKKPSTRYTSLNKGYKN